MHRRKIAPEKIEVWKNVVDFNAAVAITCSQKEELKKAEEQNDADTSQIRRKLEITQY